MQYYLRKLVLMVTFFIPFLVSAQNFVIKSIEEDQSSIEARINRHLDKSGDPCALIKFTIPGISKATFENMYVVDTYYNNFEYNVYVSKGIKKIRVKHPEAYDIVIDFAQYGIEIESLKVYRVNLYLEGVTESLIEQEIDIKVSPEDAQIVIEPLVSKNQKPIYYDKHNNSKELRLPIGDYKYIATSAGYYKVEGQFTLTAQSKYILSVELVQRPEKETELSNSALLQNKEHPYIEGTSRSIKPVYPIFYFYIEPQTMVSNGLYGTGVTFGFDIKRLNIELGGYYSFSTSEWITWLKADDSEYGTYSYRPFIGTVKLGYYAFSNRYFSMTPQVGFSFLKTKATLHSGETNLVGDGANSLGITAAYKVNWKFSNHFHFTLTPQYTIRVNKSDSHLLMEAASKRMRRWNNTFSVLVGISYKI